MQHLANLDPAVNAILGDYPGHDGHDELLSDNQQPRAQQL